MRGLRGNASNFRCIVPAALAVQESAGGAAASGISAGTAERHPPEDVPVSDSVSVTVAWVLSVSVATVSRRSARGRR